MNTLYINYTKNGTPVADCNVEERILQQASLCVNGQDKEYRVSTENVVNAVRAMKVTDKITCNLVIMFEGEELSMNEHCKINRWPYGFCDYNEKWACEILSAGLKKLRERDETK